MASPTGSIAALPSGIALSRGADESPARVRELAHEFEAMFLSQMLKQMRQSMALADDEEGDGFGKAAFTETFDTELARHISAGGGIGIASVIMEAFDRQSGERAEAGVATIAPSPLPTPVRRPTVPRMEMPVARPDDADEPVTLGPVSSAFGWRRDPINGQSRFHKGVDIKAAYGQAVPSVAPGRVVSAGDQGGYGLTVVVEHDSGIRTRYAHLSAVAVAPGEVVGRGQDVGRVGSSGRSTGPHLHFEVLEDGRPVNPATAMQKLAENDPFKKVRVVADSSIGRVSDDPGHGGVTDED
jgi:murein DD-endopeptidase MepM/ murein hydrolase activator NlpD